jgi:hypothetical protein
MITAAEIIAFSQVHDIETITAAEIIAFLEHKEW